MPCLPVCAGNVWGDTILNPFSAFDLPTPTSTPNLCIISRISSLAGKSAVVIGSTSGIGLGILHALPPALLNYMFAEKFRTSPELSASIVLAGNLAAAVVLPLTLTAIFLW